MLISSLIIAEVDKLIIGNQLEKEMATHSSALACEFYGQRSLVGCSPQGQKELDATEQLTDT